MKYPDEILFQFSKVKLWIILSQCGLFLALGFFILSQEKSEEIYAIILAVAWIIIAVFLGGRALSKILNKKFGLILNSEGIIHHTEGYSLGFIPWDEVVKISEEMSPESQPEKLIIIQVKNPEKYLKREEFLRKYLFRTRFSLMDLMGRYDTPISISAISLHQDHEELLRIFNDYWGEVNHRTL